MTKRTEDFEHVLNLRNVLGVEYDETQDQVVVFVGQKLSEDELNDEQIISNIVDEDTDVIEVGDVSTFAENDDIEMRKGRHRPIPSGVSEMISTGTAATGGPYPVKVTDTSKGIWWDKVSEGDIVRLSNAHVYADNGRANVGSRIWQPGPGDDGSALDEVGRLAGYLKLKDGMKVDVAARTTTDDDIESDIELDSHFQGKRFSGEYADLKGSLLIKSGRSTGVTEAPVLATTASIKINYGEEFGFLVCRDIIITENMAKPGDSGAESFNKDGELIAQVFGGSKQATVHQKVSNIEDQFGVEILYNN